MSRDLLCFSHLRWDFVYQRPNHLMVRAARDRRVFFVEEPTYGCQSQGFDLAERDGVHVVTPQLPEAARTNPNPTLVRVVNDLVKRFDLADPVIWYYTPMALPWTDHLARSATVFDCMDHLAGFNGAPEGLVALEAELVQRADLVLTGGAQLHAAKQDAHANVHCFPSSVDVSHFLAARTALADPADQAPIPHPRLGYCGVIDERLDLALVAAAASHPTWQIVMLGPVVKIDPASLPQAPNIRYLGPKAYGELPEYLGGWEVGIMPFAHNEATRYISPTKTPEYLAAGLAVASTGIHDVVEPYGQRGLVEIGDGPSAFVEACQRALATDRAQHLRNADHLLGQMSWDRTWNDINELIGAVIGEPLARPRIEQAATTNLLDSRRRRLAPRRSPNLSELSSAVATRPAQGSGSRSPGAVG